MRVAKVVTIRTGSATAFIEMFNVMNASNYGDYIGTLTSALFGRPTTASPKRRLQLGFRFDF
jgi:hypothetical protein